MIDVEAEALIDTLADLLALLEVETLEKIPRDVQVKARVYTLSNNEGRAKFETLGDTPFDEETMALAAILPSH